MAAYAMPCGSARRATLKEALRSARASAPLYCLIACFTGKSSMLLSVKNAFTDFNDLPIIERFFPMKFYL